MTCRHCHHAPVSRPRGLCWTCFYKIDVRALYPCTSKYGRRGLGIFRGNSKQPGLPTDALPGSEEKIRVLMVRAELGQALWHAEDATLAGRRELMQVG